MVSKGIAVYGDVAMDRCRVLGTIVKRIVDEHNFPCSMTLEMTSGIRVTIWNAARGGVPENTLELMPLYEGSYEHLFATISWYLGYYKRPRGLWAWFVPLCVCCWRVELVHNVSKLPCKTEPPFHAICQTCASQMIDISMGCPLDRCLLKTIPLSVLYEYNKRCKKAKRKDDE